jgi:hypothetical protein
MNDKDRIADVTTETMDATWRIMDGLHEVVLSAYLKSHRAVSDLEGRRDASNAGFIDRARRVKALLKECANIMSTPNKLQENAAQAQAGARDGGEG